MTAAFNLSEMWMTLCRFNDILLYKDYFQKLSFFDGS